MTHEIEFEYGTISFAGSSENSRTSHLFISIDKEKDPFSTLGFNSWETPIGKVTKGMDIVMALDSTYGDMPPWGKGPKQEPIYHGPGYLEQNFPKLDRFTTCRVSTTYSEESNIPEEKPDEDDDFYFDEEGDPESHSDSSDEFEAAWADSSSDDHYGQPRYEFSSRRGARLR